MKKMLSGVVVACLAFVVAAGCRGGGQLYEVKEALAQPATGQDASLDQIQEAIVKAGVKLGWIMTVAKPGEIIGTLSLKGHKAIVTIPFSSKTYSILYTDSTNLKYDADTHTIHKNYTGWIKRLDNEIRVHLTAIGK